MKPTFNTNNNVGNRGVFGVLLLIGALLQIGVGQAQSPKPLTEADYVLWSDFSLKAINDKGTWASYSVSHSTGDTLFVQNLNGTKRHAIPDGSDGTFNGDYFLCRVKDSAVCFLKLDTGRLKTFKEATSYQASSKHFLVHEVVAGQGMLKRYNENGVLLHTFPNVVRFSLDPTGNSLVMAAEKEGSEQLYMVDMNQPEKQLLIAEVKGGSYAHLQWNRQGTALYVMERFGNARSLIAYDVTGGKTYFLRSNDIQLKTNEALIDRSFTVTDDGKRIFFTTRQNKKEAQKESPLVQVWNAADKALYPLAARINQWKTTPHLNMWKPESGHLLPVTNAMLPWGGPIGKARHALVYNPDTYEPQVKPLADRDIYLINLNSGKKELLLKRQNGSDFDLAASPDGNHIIYFKDRDWYAYSLVTKIHVNLTKGFEVVPVKGAMPGEIPSYGIGGWVAGEQSVLIYDAFDIWKYTVDGKSRERLTNGREKGIVFRLVPSAEEQLDQYNHRTRTMGKYQWDGTLVLSARAADYSGNGFFTWNKARGVKELVYEAKNTKNIKKAKDTDTFVWTEEDWQMPIQLKVRQSKTKIRKVFASNPQQSKFQQGKMEIVQYCSSVGTPLKGLLYYPADFEEGKQYPMVVHLYEVQSRNRFDYVNPTLYNSDGFNISNLTANGYFVLLPDTVFETGKTGDDALHCVEAAVDAVLNRGEVDSKRIALMGHSFGGYQTDYIITKSRLFACAIAGAALTDLVSSAHAVAPGVDRPNFFKIENGQVRMGGPLFDEKERYIDNSPVFFANGVQTPLLSWTGVNDPQVLPTQTMEFYMALRRLGREHIMLVYPNEGHDIHGRMADSDLTRKVESWLDRYLKWGSVEEWMLPQ